MNNMENNDWIVSRFYELNEDINDFEKYRVKLFSDSYEMASEIRYLTDKIEDCRDEIKIYDNLIRDLKNEIQSLNYIMAEKADPIKQI